MTMRVQIHSSAMIFLFPTACFGEQVQEQICAKATKAWGAYFTRTVVQRHSESMFNIPQGQKPLFKTPQLPTRETESSKVTLSAPATVSWDVCLSMHFLLFAAQSWQKCQEINKGANYCQLSNITGSRCAPPPVGPRDAEGILGQLIYKFSVCGFDNDIHSAAYSLCSTPLLV